MVIKDTTLPGAKIIIPKVYQDSRGYFFESYQCENFKENGILENFVQDNEAESKKGVLRGLHYQLKYPQSKLVRVIKGDILDVAVDIRKGSKTFGRSKMIHLSSENKKILRLNIFLKSDKVFRTLYVIGINRSLFLLPNTFI